MNDDKVTALSQVSVLYVEDEPSIAELFAKGIARRVKTLYTAVNGVDGLKKYYEFKPDIIVTDINMPLLNGIEMVRKIREKNKTIPIIATTAHGEANYILDSMSLGFNGYLLKPVDKDLLFTYLESNASTIIAKRDKDKEYQILQAVLDHDQNLTVVTDFQEMIFANKSFLNFFKLKKISDLYTQFDSILDTFIENDDFLHKDMISDYETEFELGEKFYKLVKSSTPAKRMVYMLDSAYTPKSFYINMEIINKDKRKLYMINLTDITEITVSHLNTSEKAYYDGLTRVYNRNKFDELANEEINNVLSSGDNLSVAIIDIDHFKVFNDTHGHLIGDEVLIQVADTVQTAVRGTDIFARWGGEEFVILFYHTDIQTAEIVSNQLREAIAAKEHKTAGNVTASFGLTQYIKGDTLDVMFKRCDDALYVAKDSGRNCVKVK